MHVFAKPSDLKSDGHCASCIYFFFCVFFLNHLINLVAVMKILWWNLDPLIHQTVQICPVLSLFSFIYFHYVFLLIYTINFYFLIFTSLTFNVCHCLFIFTFFYISLNLLIYYLIVVYFVSTLFNLCLKLLHAYLIFVTHFIIIILLVCI